MSLKYSDNSLNNYTNTFLEKWGVKTKGKSSASRSGLISNIPNKDVLEVKSTSGKMHVKANTKDGIDDGKIPFKSKLKNFGKGLIAPFKAMVSSPKNIALTALSIAASAGIIAATGGAAAPVFIAAGLIGGGVQIGNGVYKQITAKTDAQAEKAWQTMGTGTMTVGLSAAGSKKALKVAGVEGAENMNIIQSSLQCIKTAPKQISASVKSLMSAVGGFLHLSPKESSSANSQSSGTNTQATAEQQGPEINED